MVLKETLRNHFTSEPLFPHVENEGVGLGDVEYPLLCSKMLYRSCN